MNEGLFWDVIIDKLCTEEEKKFFTEMSEEEYGILEDTYNELISDCKLKVENI